MSEERGSITLWMVGMMLVVLVVGGIAVDLWRALAMHRLVAAVVDSAAVAAGSGIDETLWRSAGSLALDPARVDERVALAVSAQDEADRIRIWVVTAGDGSAATVTGTAGVELTLLKLVAPGGIEVSAIATAVPQLSP
jgi:hypothetical protein